MAIPEDDGEHHGRLTALFTDWNFSYLDVPCSRGLVNDGNRCYRNSILTTLLHQPVFINWLDLHRGQVCYVAASGEECLACHLAHLSQKYWFGGLQDTLNEELGRFWRACSSFWDVDQKEQEDCMEFLSSLLQAMKTSLEPSLGDDANLSHMFQCITVRHTVCHNCGNASDSAPDQTYFIGAAPGAKGRGIEACIDQYMDEKVDDYHCGACKQKTEITRTLHIDDAPEVLFVHVNRFNAGSRRKDTRKIYIGEYLDLTKHLVKRAEPTKETLRYQLTAVVSHKGYSVKSGHYRSYVRRPNGAWACLDDDLASEWELEQILNSRPANFTPYILVYNRQPCHPWPKKGVSTGALQPDDSSPARELRESPDPGQIDLTASSGDSLFGEGDGQPTAISGLQVDSKENNVQIQADISLQEALKPGDGGEETSCRTSRWEGQPAEIMVQVTMGDVVLTGVLRGLLKKGPKRTSLGAKPTGISKRRTPMPAPPQRQDFQIV